MLYTKHRPCGGGLWESSIRQALYVFIKVDYICLPETETTFIVLLGTYNEGVREVKG